MTALNGFVQGATAYLLTDGCVTDGDGRVLGIESKVNAIPGLSMAVAWAGLCMPRELETEIAQLRCRSIAEALAALTTIARQSFAVSMARPEFHPERDSLTLLAAAWAAETGPALWTIQSDQLRLGPSYSPFSAARLRLTLDTPLDALPGIFGRSVDIESDALFDPRRDGRVLLEAQRRDPSFDSGAPVYAVGGFMELTMVSAAGVISEELGAWPDIIGEPISPTQMLCPFKLAPSRPDCFGPIPHLAPQTLGSCQGGTRAFPGAA